jgi:hypothetical protein
MMGNRVMCYPRSQKRDLGHPAFVMLLAFGLAAVCGAQQAASAGPIAIVPVDSSTTVTGALEITAGRAIIGASGSVTSGEKTTEVILPHRGVLRVCASTTVKLASDTSVPAGETPGLVMGLDRGALEASFATGQNADVLLTPDFRILIGGPGAADVKVRLGEHGDTCVDNAGVNAPYVLVSSVFEGGAYRVQAGDRVMFQHGSVREVVTGEKEPCGCPPPMNPDAKPGTNEFPLAASEGLSVSPPPVAAAPPGGTQSKAPDAATTTMERNAATVTPEQQDKAEQSKAEQNKAATTPTPTPAPAQTPAAQPKPTAKKQGFFGRIGSFFRKLFGAE